MKMSGWSCYRVTGLLWKMGHSEKRRLGCCGRLAVISVAAIEYPEKKQLRGESLFQLVIPGHSLSFWGS